MMSLSGTSDTDSREPAQKGTRGAQSAAEGAASSVGSAYVRVASSGEDLARLLASVATDNMAAFTELYDSTVAKVHALVKAIIRNPADAEEVTCDVYTQVWQTACRFDPSRGHVMAWLMMIARHRAIDSLRRNRCRNRLIDDQPPPEDVEDTAEYLCPERMLSLFQSNLEVKMALQQLPPERRRLVGLAFFEDMSHAEIAELTGLPLGTVKSHLRRAMQSLRDLLFAPEME
jgi:RNA polymerase sigma factor (sigma-70 family)